MNEKREIKSFSLNLRFWKSEYLSIKIFHNCRSYYGLRNAGLPEIPPCFFLFKCWRWKGQYVNSVNVLKSPWNPKKPCAAARKDHPIIELKVAHIHVITLTIKRFILTFVTVKLLDSGPLKTIWTHCFGWFFTAWIIVPWPELIVQKKKFGRSANCPWNGKQHEDVVDFFKSFNAESIKSGWCWTKNMCQADRLGFYSVTSASIPCFC